MITKLDLMDEGTDARDVLENKLLPLRRGVCYTTRHIHPLSLELAAGLLSNSSVLALSRPLLMSSECFGCPSLFISQVISEW